VQNRSGKRIDDSDTLEELIEVCRELNSLIEDNNQNIKDCYRSLKSIQDVICPPKQNIVARVISKLLNKCTRL
jgi:hypothetical protein